MSELSIQRINQVLVSPRVREGNMALTRKTL